MSIPRSFQVLCLLLLILSVLLTISHGRDVVFNRYRRRPFISTNEETSDAGSTFFSDNTIDEEYGEQEQGRGGGMQVMITRSMRRKLEQELRYSSTEVDIMDPQIAAVVIDRALTRPTNGMPVSWRSVHSRESHDFTLSSIPVSVLNCVTTFSRRVCSTVSTVLGYVSKHRVVAASCALGTGACAIYLQQGGDLSESMSDIGSGASSLVSSVVSIIPIGVKQKFGKLFGMRRRSTSMGYASSGRGRYHMESGGKLDMDSLSRSQKL